MRACQLFVTCGEVSFVGCLCNCNAKVVRLSGLRALGYLLVGVSGAECLANWQSWWMAQLKGAIGVVEEVYSK